jgi:tRNA pseudouridine synthase 10
MENLMSLCDKCKSFISSIIKENNNIISTIETDKLCEFCYNSLNNNNYNNIIKQIGEKITQYEYLNLNIQTRFSCLFSIFHSLLINKLIKNNFSNNIKELQDSIKVSQIRKSFKEIFPSIFTKQLNIKVDSDVGDMIIIIYFNFKQEIFDEVNKLFNEYQKKDANLGIITPEDDNSKIKYYVDIINNNDKISNEIKNNLTLEKICKNFYLDFKIEIAPFYLYGNYIKLDREIGQTQFSKDGVKLSLTSVDEELKKFLKNIFLNKEEECVFSAGGREDRDVRMLGHGRAFIYTIYNAKKHYSLDFNSINTELNKTLKKVQVNGLRLCDKKYFQVLKRAENEKIKLYLAFIWTKEDITKEVCDKINKIKDLKINQITPLRVLHKRVLKTREKIIYELNIKEIYNKHFMTVEIKSSAGTYIKEFVNGDLGRTYPSMCDIIGNDCDIIQLDVEDIIV